MEDNTPPAPHHTTSRQPSKVAIPRLRPQEPEPPAVSAGKHRVIKACTNCRKRKVKCTGEHPRCKNCTEHNQACVYEFDRKDRLKTATEQNHILTSLLNDLISRVSEEDEKKIYAALDAINNPSPNTSSKPSILPKINPESSKRKSSMSDDASVTSLGESRAPASVGSNGELDLLNEDLLRSKESRETGFVGQNSEIQWLRSLQRQMSSAEKEPYGLPYGPPGEGNDATTKRMDAMHKRRRLNKSDNTRYVADSSFYLDSDSLEVDTMVDPYDLPTPDIAELLFNSYMETVHNWFPILPETYKDQFHRYISSIKRGQRFEVPEKWQAVLNLVFAIGARFSQLIDADCRGESHDHLIYMTRAVRILGVKDTAIILSAPDLGLIQATGLLSFYYLAVGHVSRAWVMVGISLRFALAVGLHLRNEDPSAPYNKKLNSAMIWWSLHSIESLLSSITGRPCIIAHEDCTVPLPDVLHEETMYKSPNNDISRLFTGHQTGSAASRSPSSGILHSFNLREGRTITMLFLGNYMRIGITTRKVLKLLYSPRTATVSWDRIQLHITSLLTELDQWAKTALPLEASSPHSSVSVNSNREKLLLGLNYYSIKIMITRPCLCRLERRIKDQSDGSSNFNYKMAKTCVEAAQDLTALLPDQPDPKFIYQKGPWWCIVHNIMQAIAVFLLEMLYQGAHMKVPKGEETPNGEEIPVCIKKLLRWLKSMQHNNEVAKRAYKLAMSIVKSGNPQLESDISSMLAEEEADIDRGRLFQGYARAAHHLATTKELQEVQWQPNLYDAGNDDSVFDQYFVPENYQMPDVYGNPFLTNFDQANPISFPMDDF